MAVVKFPAPEVNRLARLYADAERDILRLITQRLEKGLEAEYYEFLEHQIEVILGSLNGESRKWCEEVIPSLYQRAAQVAEKEVKKAKKKVAVGFTFGGIHQQAVQVLAENTYAKLQDIIQTIGRRVQDVYREVALESVRGAVVGYETVPQVAKLIKQKLAERGITGFVDKLGRQWNMTSYAKMVARTTTMEAQIQGALNRFTELDQDLVKVSTHNTDCSKCRPWEGKVLSITGATKGYPTLAEARAKGLFHPNCKHGIGLYVPEFEEAAKAKEKKKAKKKYSEAVERFNFSNLEKAPFTEEELKKWLSELPARCLERKVSGEMKAIVDRISYHDVFKGQVAGEYIKEGTKSRIVLYKILHSISKEEQKRVLFHEIGHANFKDIFIDLENMWKELYEREPSVSRYARTNYREDFAESFAEFFTNPQNLENTSPAKYNFIKTYIEKGWQKWTREILEARGEL